MHTIRTKTYKISFDAILGDVSPEGDWMAAVSGLSKTYPLDFRVLDDLVVKILPNEEQSAFSPPEKIVELNFCFEQKITEDSNIVCKKDAALEAARYKKSINPDYTGNDYYSIDEYHWGHKFTLRPWVLGICPGGPISWLVTGIGPAISIGGIKFNYSYLAIEKI